VHVKTKGEFVVESVPLIVIVARLPPFELESVTTKYELQSYARGKSLDGGCVLTA
jgi:flagellar basal body P-ring protein FlgI